MYTVMNHHFKKSCHSDDAMMMKLDHEPIPLHSSFDPSYVCLQ